MKKALLFALLVVTISGCTSFKDSNTKTHVTATGTIEKLGMSTFQYGTHVLKTESKTYALKSTFALDTYIGKKVTIKGTKVAGYPIEGGPELVEVTLVKL